jgi:hypothetical protein
VFGPYLEDYVQRLASRGYIPKVIRFKLELIARLGEYLAGSGVSFNPEAVSRGVQ